jgi:hypothetical protein
MQREDASRKVVKHLVAALLFSMADWVAKGADSFNPNSN